MQQPASHIHPTAVVAAGAQIDPSATVGPYAIIGAHVRIGARTSVGPHCVIEGHTTIGADNHIFQFASLGAAPQDKKYAGEPTRLEIGDRNTIREFCTFNTGTVQDQGVTRIGDDNWIMAYVHIAHDCVVGNQVILANNATLAGHVQVGDQVIIAAANALRETTRSNDYVARYGGEEFVVIHLGSRAALSMPRFNHLLESVAQTRLTFPNLGLTKDVMFTLSCGLTQHRSGDTVESLLTRADTALYQAKKQGKNRLIVG